MKKQLRIAIAFIIAISLAACQSMTPDVTSLSPVSEQVSVALPTVITPLAARVAPATKPLMQPVIPVTGEAIPVSGDNDTLPSGYQPRETTPMPGEKSGFHPLEIMLLKLVNAQRKEVGVAPLILSTSLSRIARAHSEDMATQDFFSHKSSSGLDFGDRMEKAGFSFTHAAENLFAGNGPYDSPESALAAWLNSSDHRANMLNPVYTVVGLGYSYNADSSYGGYYTIDFAAP